MTLLELSMEYRAQAAVLRQRMGQLREAMEEDDALPHRQQLEERVRCLNGIWRETRDVAVLLERYYERGYRRNVKYTL